MKAQKKRPIEHVMGQIQVISYSSSRDRSSKRVDGDQRVTCDGKYLFAGLKACWAINLKHLEMSLVQDADERSGSLPLLILTERKGGETNVVKKQLECTPKRQSMVAFQTFVDQLQFTLQKYRERHGLDTSNSNRSNNNKAPSKAKAPRPFATLGQRHNNHDRKGPKPRAAVVTTKNKAVHASPTADSSWNKTNSPARSALPDHRSDAELSSAVRSGIHPNVLDEPMDDIHDSPPRQLFPTDDEPNNKRNKNSSNVGSKNRFRRLRRNTTVDSDDENDDDLFNDSHQVVQDLEDDQEGEEEDDATARLEAASPTPLTTVAHAKTVLDHYHELVTDEEESTTTPSHKTTLDEPHEQPAAETKEPLPKESERITTFFSSNQVSEQQNHGKRKSRVSTKDVSNTIELPMLPQITAKKSRHTGSSLFSTDTHSNDGFPSPKASTSILTPPSSPSQENDDNNGEITARSPRVPSSASRRKIHVPSLIGKSKRKQLVTRSEPEWANKYKAENSESDKEPELFDQIQDTKKSSLPIDLAGGPPKTAKRGLLNSFFGPETSTSDAALLGNNLSPPKTVINPYKKSRKSLPTATKKYLIDRSVATGLRNLGNTCYLNSSLQMLFGLPGFVDRLHTVYKESLSSSNNGSAEKQDGIIAKSVTLLGGVVSVARAIGVLPKENKRKNADDAQETPVVTVAGDPRCIKKAMDSATDKFIGYEQRDAHEFVSDLLDLLHDNMTVEKGSKETDENSEIDQSKETNEEVKESKAKLTPPPTDEYFRLDVRVCLTCDTCGYKRTKDEMYRHLSLDVGVDSETDKKDVNKDAPPTPVWSIEKGLAHFFQPEKRDIKCEKCETGASATQTMQILSRPRALLLHLKRFIVTQRERVEMSEGGTEKSVGLEMEFRKNEARVQVNEPLSIDSFCEQGAKNGTSGRNYRLRSIVRHIGTTASSGHYTTDRKYSKFDELATKKSCIKNGEWVTFDDGVTTPIPLDRVLNNKQNQRNSYMILYELE
eukprot:scaffold32479_cov44-Attheya_sp.AAC.3